MTGEGKPTLWCFSLAQEGEMILPLMFLCQVSHSRKGNTESGLMVPFLPLSVSLIAAWDEFPAGLITSNCLQLSGQLHLSPGGDGPSGNSCDLMPKELLLLPVARHHLHTSSPTA